jgi:ABC-type Mn2+/Zn2+ transport system permease subunit
VIEPLGYEFFRHALAVAVVAAIICGLVGVFVVVRGMSYIGHGLSHAVFGGAAGAAVLQVHYLLGAGVWGALCALAIGRVSQRRRLSADVVIGVVTTVSLAAGIVLFELFGRARQDLDAVLFGDVLGVSGWDVVAVGLVGVVIVGSIALGYRQLVFTAFDPEVAEVHGIRTSRVDAWLMLLVALTVLVSMRVIGVLLISAEWSSPPRRSGQPARWSAPSPPITSICRRVRRSS